LHRSAVADRGVRLVGFLVLNVMFLSLILETSVDDVPPGDLSENLSFVNVFVGNEGPDGPKHRGRIRSGQIPDFELGIDYDRRLILEIAS
jgi:hypothetical protein